MSFPSNFIDERKLQKLQLLERRIANPEIQPTNGAMSSRSPDFVQNKTPQALENQPKTTSASKVSNADTTSTLQDVTAPVAVECDALSRQSKNDVKSSIDCEPMVKNMDGATSLILDGAERNNEVIYVEDTKTNSSCKSRTGSLLHQRILTKDVDREKENRGDTTASAGGSGRHLKRISSGSSNIENKSPKQMKFEENNGNDNINAMGQDTGSRGAVGTKRTILSYFHLQGEHHTLSANVFPSSSGATQENNGNGNGNGTVSSSGSSSDGTLVSPPGKDTNSKKEKDAHTRAPQGTAGSSNKTSSNGSTTTSSSSSSSGGGATAYSSGSSQNHNQISAEVKKQLELARIGKEQAETKALRYEGELKEALERITQLEERGSKLCKSLEEVHRAKAMQEARKKRDRLALDCVRLGKIVSMRTGLQGPNAVQDVWEEGFAVNELKKRSAELLERKEELEKRRKRLQNLKRAAKKSGPGGANSGGTGASANSSNLAMLPPDMITDDEPFELDLDLAAETEAIKSHLEQLKKDETALAEEKRLLEGEKAAHQKELKRCQSEDRSRFSRDLPCLNNRYLLLSMLGRGGFSEVWKALDLVELREVAVKVHQLNPIWSEEHKQRYIKNVTREYKIHREMRHPRVVEFYDVFEIDMNSFATVLEYCRGIDLDEKLKRSRTLPEREARTILMQIVSGLKYLNTPGDNSEDGSGAGAGAGAGEALSGTSSGTRRKAIIHYDLKPANILFDEYGDAKITDFGLSKIIDESHEGTSMELTSQGAGTYWYLPPECFQSGGDARISSKVDVWSVGVIYYQMLFGVKPFGENKTQERILSEGIMLNANKVRFPVDPRSAKIPEEAKRFIEDCLTSDQRLRPDVLALCQHPYLRNK